MPVSIFSQNKLADTSLVQFYIERSKEFKGSNLDSTLYYADLALNLSNTINYQIGEIKSLNEIGNVYLALFDFKNALKYYKDVSLKSQKIDYKKGIAAANSNIGFLYALRNENRIALDYLSKALPIFEKINDTSNIVKTSLVISGTYLELNLDSALFYSQKGYHLAIMQNNESAVGMACFYMGQVHNKLNSNNIALAFLQQCADEFKRIENKFDLSTTYQEIAALYSKIDKMDSCNYYSALALKLSTQINFYPIIRVSSKLLADNYLHNKDSLIKYLKIYILASDSIFNIEKAKETSNAFTAEKLRQYELLKNEKKEKEEKKFTLKLIGISIFLILFVCLILIFRKKRINKKVIIFLGILALLMVFEFISLVLHTYLGKITGHNPIIMLIILVAIASGLVPLHQKIEKFIIQRMTKKSMKEARKNIKNIK